MKLKKPTEDQVGLKKLPEEVRNKMGYMEDGGILKYRKGHRKKCTVEAWLHICLLVIDQRFLNTPGPWLE